MRQIVNGVLLGGVLITAVAVLFRMGHVSEDAAPRPSTGRAERAERLSRLQPSFKQGPVDLLTLIDPAKDAVSGVWLREGGALTCRRSKEYLRLQIPCVPPPEYDLEILVERRGPLESFAVGLRAGERQTVVVLDGKLFTPDGKLVAPLCSTLRLIDGQARNETLFPGPVLKESGVSRVLCSVRSTGISVSVDDLKIIDFKGELKRLSLPDPWKVSSPDALFLGAFDCEYRIQRIELRPVP
jgi:hypothetical protein